MLAVAMPVLMLIQSIVPPDPTWWADAISVCVVPQSIQLFILPAIKLPSLDRRHHAKTR